jgi:hypothetical protein
MISTDSPFFPLILFWGLMWIASFFIKRDKEVK